MKKQITYLTLLFLLSLEGISQGDNQYLAANRAILKHVASDLPASCLTSKSAKVISNSKKKYDRKQIDIINYFFNTVTNVKEIDSYYQNLFHKKPSLTIDTIGDIIKYNYRIPVRGNLDVIFSMTEFQKSIVFKSSKIITLSKTICGAGSAFWTMDIKYIESFVLDKMKVPIYKFSLGDYMIIDTIYKSGLNITEPLIRINEKQFHLLNRIIWNECDVYYLDGIITPFYELTQENNVDLLTNLLYSPNHVVAINAYECLFYLQETKQLSLPSETKRKMAEIVNSEFRITYQYSDVVRQGLTYKSLGITPGKIKSKFISRQKRVANTGLN